MRNHYYLSLFALALLLQNCGETGSALMNPDSSAGLGSSSSVATLSSSIDASSSGEIQSSSIDVSSSVVGQSSSLGASSSVVVSSSSTIASSSSVAGLNAQVCPYYAAQNVISCSEGMYSTKVIGTQVWMAENLNVGTLVSGAGATANQANNSVLEKYCRNDIATNCNGGMGGLYQWAEAMDLPASCNATACAGLIDAGNHRGICPIGWHIPKASEWVTLSTFLNDSVAGAKMKMKGTGSSYWDNSASNYDNLSGFSGRPTSYRYAAGGFEVATNYANYWTASENPSNGAQATHRFLHWDEKTLSVEFNQKQLGLSVRCIKNP
jgi:uncharacterized protein (TIGR02145 family)